MIAFPTIGLALLVFSYTFLYCSSGYSRHLYQLFLLGILTFASYTPMHEAVHGNVGGSNTKHKWLDYAVGLLMSPLISIPFNSHKREHLTHHNLQIPMRIQMYIFKICLGLLKIFIEQR